MSPLESHLAHPKITSAHQQRLAYVYVRQSTPKQVEHNRESQANQYRLVERAQALGWSRERIQVIDSDQGQSGQSAQARTGFNDLLAEMSLGHVGIVFGYEVSRLARNNSDWYRLLDLATVFGTLIADSDGVYDPRLYNDRLLLGLKGTMSEAELHILRLRLDAGRLNQVRKGTYRQVLPTGLVRLPDGTVVKDPDDQVCHTLELVFAKFDELGSCMKVLRFLKTHDILLPRRQQGGSRHAETLWKQPTDAAVLEILNNPAYAGAFAYGRRQGDPTRYKPGRPAAGRPRVPMDGWIYLQTEVYPAYITWEQFLANQARLRQNGKRFDDMAQRAPGAARDGAALLQGLVVCGECGHHMQVTYKASTRYLCDALSRRVAGRACQSLHAVSIDEVVVQAFFEALRPAQLDALEGILATQRAERDQLTRHWQDRLKRARYEARLAERQYDKVDPDNRLVAHSLEQRWEEKLRQLRETEEAYARFESEPASPELTPALREQFRRLSETLPGLWNSGQITPAQKKELLRSLIAQVILKRVAADRVEAKIVWVSGHYTVTHAQPPIHREQDVTGYAQMVERIHELCEQGLDDEQIAAQLTSEGFHSARSSQVPSLSVMKIRLARQWYRPWERLRGAEQVNGCWTIQGLARRLGVNDATIYRFITAKGVIPPDAIVREPQTGRWLIRQDEDLVARLQKRVEEQKRRNGMLKSSSAA